MWRHGWVTPETSMMGANHRGVADRFRASLGRVVGTFWLDTVSHLFIAFRGKHQRAGARNVQSTVLGRYPSCINK